ncbi:hypothetical protein [Agromyces aureus]|uniref:Uncharacterized protein n=1 Tax=Agromyces aureus TaxID=453304 RepID=A0A191WDH5_9MICO|nr:hypothetical protein [Agromyces aureus]ANJ26316.1 hypothetical protein ATC03_05885 [Agromyces aureus]
MSSNRGRARVWLRRYLPLEVCGTIAALLGAWVAYEASGSLAIAAIAGSLAESVGYYALVVVRAARDHAASVRVRRVRAGRGRGRAALVTAWLTIRSVAVEFGPAELVDSVLVRPALLWAASAALGANPWAWLVGKLAADAVFYAIAIVSFELGRRVILPDAAAPALTHEAANAPAPVDRPVHRPLISGAPR